MEPTATADLALLRSLAAQPSTLEIKGVPHVILPAGFTLAAPDLERLLPEPTRTRRIVVANDIGGFIAYSKDFKTERTALFCGPPDNAKLEARLDDHKPSSPSHVTHQCFFHCPKTTEYATWMGANKVKTTQVAFAEFIENNLRDIIKPDGNEVLAAALNFRDHGSAEFSSAMRLSDGRVQFQFVEKETAGQVRFPETIEIAIPVFEGQKTRYTVKAKTRYRVQSGELTLWYELERPDLVLRQAYNDLIEEVEKQVGIAVYRAL